MLRELTKRTRDYLVSFGERLSVRIASAYLNKIGVDAKFYDAWDAGFYSDSNFMQAELLDSVWQTIPECLKDYKSGISKDIRSRKETTINLPKSDVLQFLTEDGTKVSIRPSGTEPKIKFYFGIKANLNDIADFEVVNNELNERINKLIKLFSEE
jgi:phosphomannomutase